MAQRERDAVHGDRQINENASGAGKIRAKIESNVASRLMRAMLGRLCSLSSREVEWRLSRCAD